MSAALSSAGRPCERRALCDRAYLTRSGEADERAGQTGEPRPVNVGRRVDFALVPPHERQRVARAGIRDGNARIRQTSNRRGNAGHDLEGDALLVQEQRLLAAAVEHERVTPFQPDDRPALACLLGQQKADRILVERLRRGGPHVDQLGARLRQPQQPPMHAMVVDDDVRRLEATLAAHARRATDHRGRRRRYRHTEYSWLLHWQNVHGPADQPNAERDGGPKRTYRTSSSSSRAPSAASAAARRRPRSSGSDG